jgi:hypothetical protein
MHNMIPQPAGAELAARQTAAAAALADFRAFEAGVSVQGDWAVWAGRLATAVRSRGTDAPAALTRTGRGCTRRTRCCT